ncbi:MAG: hypothetical protein JSR85_07095 [Proteobacteria bacterium]|nr:hypothetical protein [Pseudomonadota bacterium]
MKKRGSRYVYALSLLASLFSSSGAMAKISPKAFKGVTSHFKKGKEAYSPILGATALESGLLYDIRFYGNFKSGYEGEKRIYIKDNSTDPLWKLVKSLFPSPAGGLSVQTGAGDNFGKVVSSPKTVALLLNYAHDFRRRHQKDKDEKAKIKKTFEAVKRGEIDKSTLDELKSARAGLGKEANKAKEERMKALLESLAISSEDESKKKDFRENVLLPLIKAIEGSITQEEKSLYPPYTTEQVLSAFFCEKFDTQTDIWKLLSELDDEIVDKKSIPLSTKEDMLTPDDLDKIASKDSYGLDDVFDLAHAYVFSLITPYKPEGKLLSNGQAWRYDRAKDTLLASKGSFADCGEMTLRHLMNLVFFDPKKKVFDLSAAKAYVHKHSPDNPYFKNLEDFYVKQTPDLANAGSLQMRSLWNKVVGDLNAFDKPDDPLKIEYVQKDNELETEFVNLIKVFQKLFGIKLSAFPAEGIDKQKKWIGTSLETIFEVLAPHKDFVVDTSELEGTKGLSGAIPIMLKDMFSFDFECTTRAHSEINNLKLLKTIEIKDYESLLKDHKISFKDTDAENSLWLLTSETLQKEKIRHPLYRLFNKPFTDNDALIYFLENLDEDLEKGTLITEKRPELSRILTHVLENISWQDDVIFRKAMPVVLKLTKYKELQPGIEEGVEVMKRLKSNLWTIGDPSLKGLSALKKIDLAGSAVKDLRGVKGLLKLEELALGETENLKMLSVTNLPSLEKINLEKSGISILKGLKNLPRLRELLLPSTPELRKLSFSALPSLEKVNLDGSGISTLKGLKNLPRLKALALSRTSHLEELSLTGLTSLEELRLISSKVRVLKGLETLMHLRELFLSRTSNLEELSLTGLTSLEKLTLGSSKVRTLKGLETLTHLKELSLNRATGLKELSLTGLTSLEELNLSHSGIKVIKGIEDLRGLKKLSLNKTEHFEIISSAVQRSLESLNLSDSSITDFKGIGKFPRLKTLNLSSTHNLDVLQLGDLPSLEELNITSSRVSLLENLERCPHLKHLDAYSAFHLKALALKDFEHLSSINLYMTGVENVSFQNLPSLEMINLSNTRSLRGLAFKVAEDAETKVETGEKKELVRHPFSKLTTLNLEESALSEMTGLDYLSNLKELNLQNARNITKLKVSKENKDLVLKLRGSGITKMEDIEGVGFLNEDNIFF